MGGGTKQLHVAFFPLMAQGHCIPAIEIAKLFSARRVRTTIVTTPLNAPEISKSIERTRNLPGIKIDIHIIEFPSLEAGLPVGCEHLDWIVANGLEHELFIKFYLGGRKFQEPLGKFLQDYRPDCLVADFFFPWATDVASKYNIPRLVFHGTSFFSMCVEECLRLYNPHKKVLSNSEPFFVPNLPGEFKYTRNQLPDNERYGQDIVVNTDFLSFRNEMHESYLKSYGVVVNSFYELEPTYVDYFRKVLGIKAWHIGPVSLFNKDIEEKSQRGREADITKEDCLKWLDSKETSSVIYVCFGSFVHFTTSQLKELAAGLEASGQPFIWVTGKRKTCKDDFKNEGECIIEGFQKRIGGKGLIIKGWAPQVLILEHKAIGGFMTHCGWNSTLEAVSAGVPMVTWPVFAEQFHNEKLVNQVLKIGLSVGAQKWVCFVGDSVKREDIELAIKKIMVGEEAEERRNRARAFREVAKKAIEEGGSSFCDLNALLEELKMVSRLKQGDL